MGKELNTKSVAKTLAKVNFIWLNFFHLAKVLPTINSEPELALIKEIRDFIASFCTVVKTYSCV